MLIKEDLEEDNEGEVFVPYLELQSNHDDLNVEKVYFSAGDIGKGIVVLMVG